MLIEYIEKELINIIRNSFLSASRIVEQKVPEGRGYFDSVHIFSLENICIVSESEIHALMNYSAYVCIEHMTGDWEFPDYWERFPDEDYYIDGKEEVVISFAEDGTISVEVFGEEYFC